MKNRMLRVIAGFFIVMLWSWQAWAGATATAVEGTVELTPVGGAAGKLAVGQRVEPGATLKSGSDAKAVLRFDDGQSISIAANTTFVVNEYKFNPHKPAEGGFTSTLLRGAIRAVTGLIGDTNKENFKIKTPTATMGIRGTDFSLHFDGRLYIQVIEGAVSATNEAGVGVFNAANQPLGLVTSVSTLALPIQPAELPTKVQAAFRQLAAIPLTGRERGPNSDDPSCRDRR